MQDERKLVPAIVQAYAIQRILSSNRYSAVFRIQYTEKDAIAAHSIQNIQCRKLLAGESWSPAMTSGSTIIAVPAAVYPALHTRLVALWGILSTRLCDKKIAARPI